MKKKIVSLMLAAALCAMPLSVSASALTAPGSTDVTTEGTVNYADTTVYSVTLPTANCFNFVVDPQGILSATDSTNYGPDKYPAGTAGYIVATEGTGAYINNKSSVPIKLMMEAYVQSDDTTGAASSVNLLGLVPEKEIMSGIDNNMMLTMDITHDKVDLATFADETTITTENVNPYVAAITQNGQPAAGDKGTQISFALAPAAYEFTGTAGSYAYTMVGGETGDSVGLRLSGLVNTIADWSAYTGASAEKIAVKTTFSFDKLSSDYELAAFDGRAHGVLADTPAEYFAGAEYDADGNLTGAVTGAMDYEVGKGALEIPFSFGTGANELGIKTIAVNGTELDPADYKALNGVITFKSTEANIKAAMDAATPDGVAAPITIVTSDDIETTVNVTMYK